MAGDEPPRPDPPLERELRWLESQAGRAAPAVTRLRKAIKDLQARGAFDERYVLREIRNLRTRSELAANDIDDLAERLRHEPP